MKRFLSVLLISGIILSCAGCSGSSKSADTAKARETNTVSSLFSDNNSADEKDTGTDNARQSSLFNDSEGESIVVKDIDLTEEQKKMLEPIQTITDMFLDDSSYVYNWNDPESAAETLYQFVRDWKPNLNDGTDRMTQYGQYNYYFITRDLLKEYASTVFADFNGTLPETDRFQETEADNNVFVMFAYSDSPNITVHITCWDKNPDGSYTVISELRDVYTDIPYFDVKFTLMDNPNEEYVYSIASAENMNTQKVNIAGYILPAAYSYKYTKSDLADLTKDELKLARYELDAKHGEIFDDPEVDNYFRNQSWYNGTTPENEYNYRLTSVEMDNAIMVDNLWEDMADVNDYENDLISLLSKEGYTEIEVKADTFTTRFDAFFSDPVWDYSREESIVRINYSGHKDTYDNFRDYKRDDAFDVITFSGSLKEPVSAFESGTKVEFQFVVKEEDGILTLYVLDAKYDGKRQPPTVSLEPIIEAVYE